jgi:hypothetical protein
LFFIKAKKEKEMKCYKKKAECGIREKHSTAYFIPVCPYMYGFPYIPYIENHTIHNSFSKSIIIALLYTHVKLQLYIFLGSPRFEGNKYGKNKLKFFESISLYTVRLLKLIIKLNHI